jgi:hypothetical protein
VEQGNEARHDGVMMMDLMKIIACRRDDGKGWCLCTEDFAPYGKYRLEAYELAAALADRENRFLARQNDVPSPEQVLRSYQLNKAARDGFALAAARAARARRRACLAERVAQDRARREPTLF